MKLTVLLLILFLQVGAVTYPQNISLKGKNLKVDFILDQVKKQTGYQVFYDPLLLSDFKAVNIEANGIALNDFLNGLLKNTTITYSIKYNTVVLIPKIVIITPPFDNAVQVLTITGHVVDEKGLPLEGVTVKIKSSARGTVTDALGNFTADVKAGESLVFSFVGFETTEIKVGTQTSLNIVLKRGKIELGNVVVIALGIKKSTKALTYNVQEVKGTDITNVPDPSFVNGLQGKVAGVTINNSSSGIGGSTRVVLRGDKSINANNNALYVLDGIPLPNLFTSFTNGKYGGSDNSDGIADINADDITSVSVLTGPASAALYGSQAANGVILVNTKTGKIGETHLSYTNSTQLYNPFILPDFQNTYGTSSPGSFDSWGTKLAQPSDYQPKNFFQTGISETNALSISTGGEKSQTYFSAASNNSRGIIPNNTFDRYNLTLHSIMEVVKDKLKLDLGLFYIKKKGQNPVSDGEYFNPLVPVYLFPRGDDFQKYELYERFNNARNFQTQFWPDGYSDKTMQNPYWLTNRVMKNSDKDRYLMSAGLTYKALPWLNLAARVRLDNNQQSDTKKFYASTLPLFAGGSDNGLYTVSNSITKQTYADLLATINKSWGSFGINSNIGASLLNLSNNLTSVGGGLATVPNLFTLNNVITSPAAQSGFKDESQAVYGNLQLNYKGLVYVDVTGRNEWSSSLANNNKKSFFYPSVGLSFIVSDILRAKPDYLSYLKIRGSFSNVGNGIQRFVTTDSYPVDPSGVTLNPNLPLLTLRPEKTKATEVGLNGRFFKDKLRLDVTLYNSDSYNQLFPFSAPASSGYSTFYVNAGKINNKGIEAAIGLNIKIGPVSWNPTGIFTLNRNKVVELVNNVISPITGLPITQNSFNMGGTGSFTNIVNTNGSLGDIYVNKLAVDEHGYLLVNYLTGNLSADNNNLLFAGNSNPRYKIGFRNEFNYKNFSINFLVDGRFGGVVVSQTQAALDGYGVSVASAKARDAGGVMINDNVYEAEKYYKFVGGGNTILSPYVYSATNIRLREAAISYAMKGSLFRNKITGLTLSVTGRNLFMFYNKAPFDPENTSSTSTYFQGIDYFMQPSLRSVGFSFKGTF